MEALADKFGNEKSRTALPRGSQLSYLITRLPTQLETKINRATKIYDLRRAPYDHPDFTGNALRDDLFRGSLNKTNRIRLKLD